jgi:protein-S-isoprenylcysteine O-methyltransferase Ste14
MKRVLAFVYGVACYIAFLAAFAYAIGFLGNFVVPKSIDSPTDVGFVRALLINCGLLMVFALQHSVMARPWFKKRWTRFVAEPVERSTYVLFSSLALMLLFWLWQPMGGVVWSTDSEVASTVVMYAFGMGWAIVFVSTLLINHFDLFGMRQVWLYLRKRPYTHLEFRTPLFYSYVRHPLYLGWLVVFWSAPRMTVAHLVFALATTAYIFLAIRWEENDLIKIHGHRYEMYRDLVPMIVPTKSPARSAAGAKAAEILAALENSAEAPGD